MGVGRSPWRFGPIITRPRRSSHTLDRRGCGALVGLLLDYRHASSGSVSRGHDPGVRRCVHVHPQFIQLLDRRDSGLQLPTEASAPRWLDGFFHAGTSPLTTTTLYITDVAIIVAASPSSSWPISSRVEPVERCASFATMTWRPNSSDLPAARPRRRFHRVLGVRRPRRRVVDVINNSVSPRRIHSRSRSRFCRSSLVIGGIGTISGAVIGGIIYAFSTNVISWITTQTVSTSRQLREPAQRHNFRRTFDPDDALWRLSNLRRGATFMVPRACPYSGVT